MLRLSRETKVDVEFVSRLPRESKVDVQVPRLPRKGHPVPCLPRKLYVRDGMQSHNSPRQHVGHAQVVAGWWSPGIHGCRCSW